MTPASRDMRQRHNTCDGYLYAVHFASPTSWKLVCRPALAKGGKDPRFDVHLPVLLRTLEEPWITTETADVGATGAMFLTERPFLLNAPVEYVLSYGAIMQSAARLLWRSR